MPIGHELPWTYSVQIQSFDLNFLGLFLPFLWLGKCTNFDTTPPTTTQSIAKVVSRCSRKNNSCYYIIRAEQRDTDQSGPSWWRPGQRLLVFFFSRSPVNLTTHTLSWVTRNVSVCVCGAHGATGYWPLLAAQPPGSLPCLLSRGRQQCADPVAGTWTPRHMWWPAGWVVPAAPESSQEANHAEPVKKKKEK